MRGMGLCFYEFPMVLKEDIPTVGFTIKYEWMVAAREFNSFCTFFFSSNSLTGRLQNRPSMETVVPT